MENYCFQCGECCRSFFKGMLVTKEELKILQDHTDLILETVEVRKNRYRLLVECPFIEHNQCSIYDLRPCQCRLYHCGRLTPGENRVESIDGIRTLMKRYPNYNEYKQARDDEGVAWGNAHGWNWTRR